MSPRVEADRLCSVADTWILDAAKREGWPDDEVDIIETELSELGISLEPRDDGVAIVNNAEPWAFEPLDQSQRHPTRLAIWALIEREQERREETQGRTG
jgi:hypothetical protein